MALIRFSDVILATPSQELILLGRETPVRGIVLPGTARRGSETAEAAAVRVCRERLGRRVLLREEFHTYPFVDIYGARVGETTVFIATAVDIDNLDERPDGERRYRFNALPPLVSAHQIIVEDYLAWVLAGRRPSTNSVLPACSRRFAERLAA